MNVKLRSYTLRLLCLESRGCSVTSSTRLIALNMARCDCLEL